MRSRTGPEMRSRYRRRISGVHSHCSATVPPCPHGHGLAASTSWNRAGKTAVCVGPGHHDVAALERLAQCIEHVGGELGRLVEEQHAAVGQRQRAGPDAAAAAADDGHRARGVVRVDERRPAQQRRIGRQHAGQRVHGADLERVARAGDRAADRAVAGPASSCRCRAGRPSNRWCPPAAATTSAVRDSSWPATSATSSAAEPLGAAPGEPADVVERRHRRVVGLLVADEHRDRLPQRPHADDGDAGHQPGLGHVGLGHDDPVEAGLGGGHRGRQDAAHRPQPAVERQLAEEDRVGQRLGAASAAWPRTPPDAIARS